MSVVSSRSRFLVNTVATHTGSSMPRPTNQRNIRLYCICSINWRVVPTARLWRDPNGKQDLDQAGPDKPLGCNRRATEIGIERGKLAVEAGESVVDHLPDLAQRMPGRNALLKIHVAEQRTARFIHPAHLDPHRSPSEEESCSPIVVQKGLFQHPAKLIRDEFTAVVDEYLS